jgi:hypothetical protein
MNVVSVEILIQTLASLKKRLEGAFQPDTAARGFHGATASTGHCATVAVIIHEILGGEMVSAFVEGHSHWLNRLKSGGRCLDVDLTGDQFGRPSLQIADAGTLYPDARVRSRTELTEDTLIRAHLVATRAGLTVAVTAIELELGKRSAPTS